MYSIFHNLITNSIKYRQPGIAPIIEITSTVHQGKIDLVFKDNGLGIDLKRKGTEVFGLYKRFHHHVEGKGMGLFMVKTHVETIGGTISIESEINKGTTFTISFPTL
jgi:signal transduction histidine kinase